MQGYKQFKPKLFTNFFLPDIIPEDNFYKVLKKELDLSFIYKETDFLYSHTGKPSIDPVVFFKCMIIGYLENICSDRALERHISMRMDLRYFIDYDIDESTPDHSTFCKTRKRIPTDIFQDVFDHILKLCVQAGLVGGRVQAIDSAYINANASIDRLVEVKMIDRDPKDYLDELTRHDGNDQVYGHDDEDIAKKRIAKSQKSLERYAQFRKEKYSELDGGKEHRKNKRRFLSNATHMSTTDPDARVAKKSGKPRMLCYSSMMSVDTKQNVITHMSAELAHKKDSRYLLKTTISTQQRLSGMGLHVDTILADAGFSSGENYHALDQMGIDAFIPIHGGYKPHREGFDYDRPSDTYTCSQGQEIPFGHIGKAGGYYKKRYFSKKKICDQCPIKTDCVGKRGFKKIEHTIYKKEYDQMIQKLKSHNGKQSYALRMYTVEPVFGTLQQHYGLRWINTRGKDLAHKVMLMAAVAINLKKLVKKRVENGLFICFSTSQLLQAIIDSYFNPVHCDQSCTQANHQITVSCV